jgi:glycine dehydrogenase subunit 1
MYFPHTDNERDEMLAQVGCRSLSDLFHDVPERHRFPELDLPDAVSELEADSLLRELADYNKKVDTSSCFLGAGAYNHFIPAIVDDVLRRSEFYTSYTPYQPELSQGMLQAMFEYQTMVCRLTGMEVSNASHYDGATSLAEAVLLALNVCGDVRNHIVISSGLNPQFAGVLQTYLRGTDTTVTSCQTPAGNTAGLAAHLSDKTAAVVIQSPDFFGQMQVLDGLADKVHASGALLIVVSDPISLGLFKPPGDYGADIVVAEGQPLGIPLSYGGPHLGIFATRKALVRRMAGRLVGETVDSDGNRGYVLTLATREQHIRRARATSNICTNAALTALAATVYLAALGKHGLRSVAELCYHNSHYAAARIRRVAGLEVNPQAPDGDFFKEFVVDCRRPARDVIELLIDKHGIAAGHDLGEVDSEMANHLLVAVTEMNSREAIDRLVDALRQVTT